MSKRPITFDLEALRSFVWGMELGSFALAADRLSRSTSAVSAHLKKLEQQCGTPLTRKAGRQLVATGAGERLLGYARRLLALNDEAFEAVLQMPLEGQIRFGMQEDFSESVLPAVLGQFSRAHPNVRMFATVNRNAELLKGIRQRELDLALSWQDDAGTPHSRELGRLPLRWIASPEFNGVAALSEGEPLPLVMLDAPCLLRSRAIAALDRSGIPWRVAFVSRSLSGIWAAVSEGLGITVRTEAGMPSHLVRLGCDELPALGDVGIQLHQAQPQSSDVTTRLAEILSRQVLAFGQAD